MFQPTVMSTRSPSMAQFTKAILLGRPQPPTQPFVRSTQIVLSRVRLTPTSTVARVPSWLQTLLMPTLAAPSRFLGSGAPLVPLLGHITQVRSCTTWPCAMVPAQLMTRVVPSGSRFQRKASNLMALPGTKHNFSLAPQRRLPSPAPLLQATTCFVPKSFRSNLP